MKRWQQGLSFLELLLAAALMAILMLALMSTTVAVLRLGRYQKALVELQQKGRFFTHYLTRRIHHAGNWDCMAQQPAAAETPTVQGWTAAVARRTLRQPIAPGSDVLLINSCRKYHRKRQWLTTAFFVAQAFQTKRRKRLGLYKKIVQSKRRTELKAEVVDMQIRYGIARHSAATGVIYQTVSQVRHWQQVRSIEVALLLRSRDSILVKAQTYWYNGKRCIASDRHFYLPWIVYVSLREAAHAQE